MAKKTGRKILNEKDNQKRRFVRGKREKGNEHKNTETSNKEQTIQEENTFERERDFE